MIRRFAKSILDSIADAGEKLLDLKRNGSSTLALLNLCEDLVSHKGVASGIALAREVVNCYRSLERNDKLTFFLELSQRTCLNMADIKAATDDFSRSPGQETLRNLSVAMESKRQKLFTRMNMAPNGTPAIVTRQDLLSFIADHLS